MLSLRKLSTGRRSFTVGKIIYKKAGTKSAPCSSKLNSDVPGLSDRVIKPSKGPVGPGASKGSQYKNPEYFSYDRLSYYEAEIEMAKYRTKKTKSQQLEIKKMRQGMSYSCKEKTIILNVFKYFCLEFSDKCVTEIVRRTAKATGCSEKSIFQFRKEEASDEGFKEPSKTKIRKNININSRDIKYDDTVRQSIRNIVYDLKYKNIIPSLNTVLRQVNVDSQLPNFSLMTLRRLLFDMGFFYVKNGKKAILTEKDDENSQKYGAAKKVCVRPNSNHETIGPGHSVISVHTAGSVTAVSKQLPSELQYSNVPPNNVTSLGHFHHQHQVLNEQCHRLVPVHGPVQTETHMLPPPMHHHSMPPVLLNHRTDFASPLVPTHQSQPSISHQAFPIQGADVNLHFKRDLPPWMHSSNHSMIKAE